ncbi:MAG: hypothetical protein WCV90_08410 [Candidatus Woesearchaeota archaeon]
MAPEKITLYHGGKQGKLRGILTRGLDSERDFFLTPNESLARESSRFHLPRDEVLIVDLPRSVYEEGIEQRILVRRDYMGTLPLEGCQEVVVKAGEGINLIESYIRKDSPNFSARLLYWNTPHKQK